VIDEHNVVLAYMPGTGTTSAAAIAGSLRVSFPNIKLAVVRRLLSGTDQEELACGNLVRLTSMYCICVSDCALAAVTSCQ